MMTVRIKAGKRRVELTVEEARELYNELRHMFQDADSSPPPSTYPISPIHPDPVYPWTFPGTVTFD